MQINLIDLFNFLYRGDAKDISHLISFGKFYLSLPGQKILLFMKNCWTKVKIH